MHSGKTVTDTDCGPLPRQGPVPGQPSAAPQRPVEVPHMASKGATPLFQPRWVDCSLFHDDDDDVFRN